MDFNSVSQLLSDTSLSYSNVSASDVINAGGYIYDVAPDLSGVISRTNLGGHHVETAGGVKLFSRRTPLGFDATAFGAVGDNSTPCFNAFQRAIFATGDSGGRVTFPAGKFRIGQTILTPPNSLGVTLSGENLRASRLIWDGGEHKMFHADCENGNFVDNFRLTDFMFDNVGSATHAVYTSGVRLLMERVFANPYNRFENAIVAGAANVTTYCATLNDCHFFSSRVGQSHEFAVDFPRGHTFNANGCMFSGHITGIRLGSVTALAGANISGCRFESFSGQNAGYPGGPDCTGVRLGDVWAANLTGNNFELASDTHPNSAGHRAIKYSSVKGLNIAANVFQGHNIAEYALETTDSDVGGVGSGSNRYFELALGIIEATGSGNASKIYHTTNYVG